MIVEIFSTKGNVVNVNFIVLFIIKFPLIKRNYCIYTYMYVLLLIVVHEFVYFLQNFVLHAFVKFYTNF